MKDNDSTIQHTKKDLLRCVLLYLLCYAVSFGVYLLIILFTAGSFPDISLLISGFGALFTATGMYILIDTLTETRGKDKRCTEEITGTVCGYETEYGEGRLFRSRFMFKYKDRMYIVRDVSSSTREPKVGSEIDLMINPTHPTDYFSPSIRQRTNLLLYLVSLVFGVTPLIMVAAAYFSR